MPEHTLRNLRILLVSVEAPPSNNAEALQVGKILAELRRQPNCIVDVVTAAPETHVGDDLTALLQSDVLARHSSQVIQLPARLRRWQRGLMRVFMPWLANRPDWFFLFTWLWHRVIPRLEHKPDLVYSRSFPPSSTLAAYRLVRYFRVPWFLHLSDPWCESSLESDWNHSHWHRRKESQCLHTAHRISFTSPVTLERYQRRYPEIADRMVIDPNVYAESSLNTLSWQPGSQFCVVHTGSFTEERPIDPLIRAFSSLPEEHPLFDDLVFIQAGHSTPHSRHLLKRAGSWIRDLGLVPPEQATRLQVKADLLFAIDWRFASGLDSQFLLSKLNDYMAIRRPILVVTHPEGASARFVSDHRLGSAVSHTDPAGIMAVFLDYWQAWKARDRQRFELPPPSPAYSASQVAAAIAADARSTLGSRYAIPT